MRIIEWTKLLVSRRFKALLKALGNRDLVKSYSQFGEDVYISAYFKGKTWTNDAPMQLPNGGFYVDIGAYSPTECSNTYMFYKHGWCGINVDATPGIMDSFSLIRKRDINLNIAICSENSDLVLYCWGEPCVFNTADPALAKQRTEQLSQAPYEMKVPCMTLASLLDRYLPADRKIDFMSVDVEGLDLEVIKSNDWKKYRPELIVAEVYSSSLEQLIDTEICRFLSGENYRCIAWLQPSIIFRDDLSNR